MKAERIRAVAFDLDGTLVDTAPDIAAATSRMLMELGLPDLPESVIRGMIGHGVDALVRQALAAASKEPVSDKLVESALPHFEAAYQSGLYRNSRLFPGVRTVLDDLFSMRVPAVCVTNKRSRFSRPILVAAGINQFFAGILCADTPEQKKPKPALLREACNLLEVEPRALLMVGDSSTDIATARAAGCPIAAVLYGYHQNRLLESGAPDWTLRKLSELGDIVLHGEAGTVN